MRRKSRDSRKGRRRWLPGESVGDKLTVLHIVDDGGRDPVYVVWNHEAWCPMACKRMRSEKHAAREAGVLSSLSHPNIVSYYGRLGADCLLMEYLEGPTLRRMLQRQPVERLKFSDALRTGIHIAAALSHLHARGIAHLDVKPRNIAIVHGRPVLFDFGIARPSSEWGRAVLEGTDPYMAPEQCRREPVSPATDVYALGVTLFEMLAGKPPFPDGSKRREFPQLEVAPRRLRPLRPSVPLALEDLVLTCLAPEPHRRPQIPELMVGLHRHIRGGARMWPQGFDPLTAGAARRAIDVSAHLSR